MLLFATTYGQRVLVEVQSGKWQAQAQVQRQARVHQSVPMTITRVFELKFADATARCQSASPSTHARSRYLVSHKLVRLLYGASSLPHPSEGAPGVVPSTSNDISIYCDSRLLEYPCLHLSTSTCPLRHRADCDIDFRFVSTLARVSRFKVLPNKRHREHGQSAGYHQAPLCV